MFEDFGKMLVNIGQNVMKKTGEVTEIAALHTKVLAKKKKIEDEYRALGKEYYEAHKNEITEFSARIEAVNTLYTEIAALEADLRELKEKFPESDGFTEPEEEAESAEPEDVEEAESVEVEEEAESAESEDVEEAESVESEEDVSAESEDDEKEESLLERGTSEQ